MTNPFFQVISLQNPALQGDVQEEDKGEEWSDAGRLPHQHLPAADVT